MAAPPLHPELMPSLRQLVRGLELLFWALPFALVVCVQEITSMQWASWGVLPLMLSMALLWFGASRLKFFQPQEGIWQGAVRVTEVLALVMVGLAPFLHWANMIPEQPAAAFTAEQKHIIYSTGIFCAISIMFLINLNHLLTRLAAMLPDPILRADVRLFAVLNFILFVPLLASLWGSQLSGQIFTVLQLNAPDFAQRIGTPMVISGFLKAATLWIATLLIAVTMAMLWKTKETVLNGVFSLEPPIETEEGEIVIKLGEPGIDDGPPEEKPKPLDPSLN